MKIIAQLYLKLLLVWATILLVWGIAGFFEYFTSITPFIELQNQAYPNGLQFIHWLLISSTGTAFLLGYLIKWNWTPIVMVSLFSNLAILCTIETFDFMSEQWSFSQYIIELVFYLVTSIFLLFAKVSKSHFKL